MTSFSLLYKKPQDYEAPLSVTTPPYAADLNLDQILEGIRGTVAEYGLDHVFYHPLTNTAEITYRQEIFQDLEQNTLLEGLRDFSNQFRLMRNTLASIQKLENLPHREGWFLQGAHRYCTALRTLSTLLSQHRLRSEGLLQLTSYLQNYLAGTAFKQLETETEMVLRALGALRFDIIIQGLTVRIKKYEGEEDFSSDIEATFSRFRQGATKNYLVQYTESPGLSSVEERILNNLVRLFPEEFENLHQFCETHAHFIDETIDRAERELQWYIAYLNYIQPLKEGGLPFCYPRFVATHEMELSDVFDLALAKKLITTAASVIPNDLRIAPHERVVVITGPNQGGKTTFARAIGQLCHLGALGLPVPGTGARLWLIDRIFTHFEREESVRTQRGRLHEELIHLHKSLQEGGPESLFILNEPFSSTTTADALLLSLKILTQILQKGSFAIWVTFLDELASYNEQVVSMVSCIDPEDPSVRTFKVERREADGLAYAHSIAEKYHLTYQWIKQRLLSQEEVRQ